MLYCINTSKVVGIQMVGIPFGMEVQNMKMSTKGKYGLKALIDLAQHSENGPVSITSIAQRQGISERYLEQLMSKLKKVDIVTSIRGANGGYTLNKDATEISVGDILRALEGNIEPVECLGIQSKDGCQSACSCVSKIVWKRINDSVKETVDAIFLSELVDEGKKMNHTIEQLRCN